jgi:hypothetical protein
MICLLGFESKTTTIAMCQICEELFEVIQTLDLQSRVLDAIVECQHQQTAISSLPLSITAWVGALYNIDTVILKSCLPVLSYPIQICDNNCKAWVQYLYTD